MTASLGVNEHYTDRQRFAARACEAGFRGIRYPVRHDPAQKLYGVVLFGGSGAPARDDPDWPDGSDEPIGEELIDEAQRLFR